MTTRGSITIDSTNTVLSLQEEEVSILGGIMNLNLPFTSSELNFAAAIKGRVRQITLKGQKNGTQLEIEAFITIIENWMNQPLSLGGGAKYYPLHHKVDGTANTLGDQKYYYNVKCQDFIYKFDTENPTRIIYTLTMIEGTLVGTYSNVAGGTS